MKWLGGLGMMVAVLGLLASGVLAAPAEAPAGAGHEGAAVKAPVDSLTTLGLAASVAFVTAVSIVGAGMAVGRIGSAAIGAAAEKPELLTRSLIFVALAEGLAVLGFAIAILLWIKM